MFQAGRGSRDNEATESKRALQGEPPELPAGLGLGEERKGPERGAVPPSTMRKAAKGHAWGYVGIKSLRLANV